MKYMKNKYSFYGQHCQRSQVLQNQVMKPDCFWREDGKTWRDLSKQLWKFYEGIHLDIIYKHVLTITKYTKMFKML